MFNYNFDEAVFTYIVTAQPIPDFAKHTTIAFGKLMVSHTAKTKVTVSQHNQRELALIGLCVDAYGELRCDDIPNWFLSQKSESIVELYRYFDRFSGKFVAIYSEYDNIFVWGDASCSIPISYSQNDSQICLSSIDHLTAQYLGSPEDPYGKQIRLGSNFSQGMPGDLTPYRNVRILLPNHYLDLQSMIPVRVPVCIPSKKPEEIISSSHTLIRNIARAYADQYQIVCPLTSGYDSRLVFAYLSDSMPSIHCYTFQHPHFSENTDDIWVPRKLCSISETAYHLIPDLSAPSEYLNDLKQVIGPYHAPRTINLAYTYLSRWKGNALVSGDISDQIGKSLLGNAVPVALATPLYFQCKIHNTDPASRRELKQYLSEIRKANQWDYVYDLFALENRCGRWASQTSMIYSVCGIDYLNIFNCRELIQLWMGLPRKLRVQCYLHKSLLYRLSPELLSIPFNPHDSRTKFLKQNWFLFYLATFGKFVYQKLRSPHKCKENNSK